MLRLNRSTRNARSRSEVSKVATCWGSRVSEAGSKGSQATSPARRRNAHRRTSCRWTNESRDCARACSSSGPATSKVTATQDATGSSAALLSSATVKCLSWLKDAFLPTGSPVSAASAAVDLSRHSTTRPGAMWCISRGNCRIPSSLRPRVNPQALTTPGPGK